MTIAASASRFLDLRALAALERMRFTTKHRIEGAYSGRHVSRQKGGAGEFVDHREYSPGEDLRRVDWKVLLTAVQEMFHNQASFRCCSNP